jgi:hypothetical protein
MSIPEKAGPGRASWLLPTLVLAGAVVGSLLAQGSGTGIPPSKYTGAGPPPVKPVPLQKSG